MAKGDKIALGLDIGGTITPQEIIADKAGREVRFTRQPRENLLMVEVIGRAGTVARTYYFRLDAVVYMREEPA